MFMSDQNVRQCRANKRFENLVVKTFKSDKLQLYLTRYEGKTKWNACYHSIQNLLSSYLLPKNLNITVIRIKLRQNFSRFSLV